MKNIIVTLIAVFFTAALFAQGEQPTITYALVNQGDTLYSIKKTITYSNGDYDESQKVIGTDSTAVVAYINTFIAEAANAHTEVSGLESQVLNADTKAFALSRDVNSLCTSFLGNNLIKANADNFKSNFQGTWVVRDLANNTTNTYTLVDTPTGVALQLNSNPATKITVWILSPVRMELRNFPAQGTHTRLGYRQTNDNGKRVFTNVKLGGTGANISVVGVQTLPAQPTE